MSQPPTSSTYKVIIAIPIFMAVIMSVVIGYMVGSPLIQAVTNVAKNQSLPVESQQSFNILGAAWQAWVVVAIIGFTVWLIHYVTKREPRSYEYGY